MRGARRIGGRSVIVALAAVVFFLAFASLSRAQPPDKKKQALAHYKQGDAYMRVGAYDEAIIEFKAGYVLMPKPGFLFNIGLAYEAKGDSRSALEHYRKYLERSPEGLASAEARARSLKLEQELATARTDSDAGAPAKAPLDKRVGTTEPSEENARRVATVQVFDDEDSPNVPWRELHKSPARGRGYKVIGLGVAATGFAVLGTGVYFGVDADSAQDHLSPYTEGRLDWSEQADTLLRDRDSAALRANIAYGVGAVAVITGAILYYVGTRKAAQKSGEVSIAPRRHGGAIVSWSCPL